MRIINLIENTQGRDGCVCAHGLSFYIETADHKLLVDLGPSDETLRNAEKLGIDLKAVDTVILSHGHYDHAGGVLPFARVNPTAAIYMQRTATLPYYADDGGTDAAARYRYIGIDAQIAGLPQVRMLDGDCTIDGTLSLFVAERRAHKLPFGDARLKLRTGDAYVQDPFAHEQYLVIRDGGRRTLVSGCAHNGILNILAEYKRKYGDEPDAVISGFHLMKKTAYTESELDEIDRTALALKRYDTVFYTCHCTGVAAFDRMEAILGDRLRYVHTGEEIL